jgi:polysaccharide deacetylase 2 family uncharacterized protein YibQ
VVFVINTFKFFCLTFILSFSPLSIAKQDRVAIVIDDIGYRFSDAKALELPGSVTYSILPHTPYGKTLALRANKQNDDVLLHIPMESLNGKSLGPGALTSNMSKQGIYQSLAASFEEIPFAIGINNHMGSRLTTLYQPMAWTMSFLKENHLFFLDSKTSRDSQAEQAAIDSGVPVLNRHVFLDNELSDQYIEQQFNLLIAKAHSNDFAIAIAHPHPATVKNLTRLIPLLKAQNIVLVPLSDFYIDKSLKTVALNTTE